MDARSEPPTKRFKYQSYQASLKSVHLSSATSRSILDDDITDTECHFHHGLDHWRQLDLSPVFVEFADKVYPLSSNVALLLHHSKDIVDFWLEAMSKASDDTIKTLFDLLQKLLHDLRDTLRPHYKSFLIALFQTLDRNPSADALTTLLTTLTLLFKHLLKLTVPEIEETWHLFAATLVKCNHEVQRALSEVWGSLMRRLKGDTRRQVCQIMLQNLQTLRDAITWVFVYAFQSVARTLHTCTAPLFEDLLSLHISDDGGHSAILLKRIITALTHHCEKPEQFLPFADVLISKKGSRLTQKQISTVLLHTIQQQQFPHLSETLTLVVACLIAGDMSVWMSSGRRLIEYSWEHPNFGLKLSEALSFMDWDGWKLIELPLTMKHTLRVFETHPIATLSLLSTLAKAKRLNDYSNNWLSHLSTMILKRLESWNLENGSVTIQMDEISYILDICSILPSTKFEIIRIAKQALHFTPAIPDEAHDAFIAQTFGACLKILAQLGSESSGDLHLAEWSLAALKKWSNLVPVLQGLVSISNRHKIESAIPFDTVYPYLKDNILSHIHVLRLASLEFLTSSIVDSGRANGVLKQCLLGESASLDITGVRERIVRITGLPPVSKNGDDVSIDISLRWLIAQFKVNLRPVWNPTVKVLAELIGQCGEKSWSIIFLQLESVSLGATGGIKPQPESDTQDQVMDESERSWRDPSASRLSAVIHTCIESRRRDFVNVEERFDASNFEVRLLETLGEASSLTERHNADIIRLFLTFGSPELSTKPPRNKLKNWLTLFSKLDNPKAFYKTETLQTLYRNLLSHPERELQNLSLTCLLNYKNSHLLPYAEHFRAFLDDTRLRDQLATFDPDDIDGIDREEAVGVLIRLFFGLMVGRSGSNRRATLLDAIGRCHDEELGVLTTLMLEPFSTSNTEYLQDRVGAKQAVGFLNLLRDVLKRLGSRITAHWSVLIDVTIRIVAAAQRRITTLASCVETDVKDYEDKEEEVLEDLPDKYTDARLYRNARLLGVRCFTDFFRRNVQYDFTSFLPAAFEAIIQPRLAMFEQENVQTSSAILELFLVWSSRVDFVEFLVIYDERVLPKIYACLLAANVKPAVINRVFDIVEHIITFAEGDTKIADLVLKPHIHGLLDSLMAQLPGNTGGELLHRQVSILSRLAQFVSDGQQAQRLIQQFAPFLRKPTRIISEKIKTNVLIIIRNLISYVYSGKHFENVELGKTLLDQLYRTLSILFQSFRIRSSRLVLLNTFAAFVQQEDGLQRVHTIMESLNSFSAKRIEEPDFERRLSAYALINEELYLELKPKEWLPLLHNMLFFIQDPDELIIRTNAAFSLKRFIEVLSSKDDESFNTIFTRTLFPALKNGLAAKTELVRNEILSVLAFSIQKCDKIEVLSELHPLLAQGDTEANFFNNIYHIQTHRRTRALRRLSEHVASGTIRNTTINELFIPITNHFIADASTTDHILVDVAISTLGSLAQKLNWAAYNSLVQHYLRLIKNKETIERASVRALISVLENFHFPMEEVVVIETEDHSLDGAEALPAPVGTDERADSQREKISDAVNTRLLPSLLRHLETRDENEDALRIPISVGIAQVALHLSKRTRDTQITRLLTVISQVFRSKSFETRKLARDTLCRILIIIGPDYLSTAITELRTALLRGSHLHVLATVTHALLARVTLTDLSDRFKSLDSCAADIAHIAAEVIFGQSGKDVQTEGFATTVQEVRGSSSKGLASYEILSRHITSAKLSALLNPIKGIMYETAAAKTMQSVDDVLRRISTGLNANEHISNAEFLSLCHTLIEQNSHFLRENRIHKGAKVPKNFAVQTKRQLEKEDDYFSVNKHRLVVLGLELFNTAFRRGKFDLKDPEVLSRLEAMVPVIGNSLYSQDSPVVIQSLKSTMSIVKYPLKAVDDSLSIFVKQTMDLVKQASNTESDVAQAAFRTLAVIIRDCPSSQIKEKDLTFLIELVTPDLEDPSRQAAIFSLLRAIVSRKLVVVEIYDMMDKVAEIMVTNQVRQVQEMCRKVLLQFLLDYPQGQGRLRKQMDFISKNLSYPFEMGRLSVMELLAAILNKFDPALIREYADMFFVALVMVIANDDSSKCKETAASLIKLLFDQLDPEHRKVMASRLHLWSSEKSSSRLACVSAQVYGILVENLKKSEDMNISVILDDMNVIVKCSLEDLEKFESAIKDSVPMEEDFAWQLPYHALNTIYKTLRGYPDYLLKEGTTLDWSAIHSHLVYPHAWVRNVSSKLVGLLFSTISPFNPKTKSSNVDGLSFINLKKIALSCCTQLKGDTLDASLSLQIVKNLFFIGKCFALVDCKDSSSPPTQDANEAEIPFSNAEDNPLPWLFSKLSYQVRSALLARRNRIKDQENWCEQPLAVFRWFAAMSLHLPPSTLVHYLNHMLNPIYRVLEDDSIHDNSMEELKTLAMELLDLIQGQVGTTKFSEVYNTIKHRANTVRQERKVEIAMRSAKDPRSAAKRKIARNLTKKKSRARRVDFLV
ncbi:hypothetical protein Clacol_002639 [Clathrus columnatus]|uniref:U3 small nucleolar RNA-associated protein 20 n=1 Tax=Clathrus columnatus TaxID=1419009 RepID=A0AAV5A5D9_9AGAM|nr:hypothetical protein Clacol_002639 [Clathrus columnatus]